MIELRCLKIHPKWLNLILNGEKEIEVRRRGCATDEVIALGNTKTKCVEGYCRIFGVQELPLENFKTPEMINRTMVSPNLIDKYANGKETLWSWVIRSVHKEPNPYRYKPSCGSWGKAYAESIPYIPYTIMGMMSPKFLKIFQEENEAKVKTWKEKQLGAKKQ